MNAETIALARQNLLHTVAAVLEALFAPTAVPIISDLKPAMMLPGGARVLGTSYELAVPAAAQTMQQLLALRGGSADRLLAALAQADMAARAAIITGAAPASVSSLYAECATVQRTAVTPDLVAGADAYYDSLHRLHLAVEQLFTLTQSRRIDTLLHSWLQQPGELDAMPVQKFVAQFVRNAPP
jgi:hypothetical protein